MLPSLLKGTKGNCGDAEDAESMTDILLSFYSRILRDLCASAVLFFSPVCLGLLNRAQLDAATVLQVWTRLGDLTGFGRIVNADEKESAESVATGNRD